MEWRFIVRRMREIRTYGGNGGRGLARGQSTQKVERIEPRNIILMWLADVFKMTEGKIIPRVTKEGSRKPWEDTTGVRDDGMVWKCTYERGRPLSFDTESRIL